MIRAYVADHSFGFGVNIGIIHHPPEGSFDQKPRIMRLAAADNRPAEHWDELEEDNVWTPTLTLEDNVARALLQGLDGHYHGAEDTRALRRDYDAERKRSDTLIGHLADLAKRLADPPPTVETVETPRAEPATGWREQCPWCHAAFVGGTEAFALRQVVAHLTTAHIISLNSPPDPERADA